MSIQNCMMTALKCSLFVGIKFTQQKIKKTLHNHEKINSGAKFAELASFK